MGQAKQRGTFEERKASAIQDQETVLGMLAKQELAWWNGLTPDEQKRVAKNRITKKIVRKIRRESR